MSSVRYPMGFSERLSEMVPPFVVDGTIEVSEQMKEYQEATWCKTSKNSRKILGVVKAKEIIVYASLRKWYLEYGFMVTAIHELLLYKPGQSFDSFQKRLPKPEMKSNEMKFIIFSKINLNLQQFQVTTENKTQGNL